MIATMKKPVKKSIKRKEVAAKPVPVTVAGTVTGPQAIVPLSRSLCEKALLIQLSISCFTGGKKDKRLSSEVVKEEQAKEESIRVWKSLCKSEQLNAVVNLSQKMRLTYYKLTAPFAEDGMRIVKTSNYIEVKTKLEGMKREFLDAVARAVADYDSIVEADKKNLGTAFDIADYPTKVEFASRFKVNIMPFPVPANDYRSGHLSPEDVTEINANIEKLIQDRVKIAGKDALERMAAALFHIYTKLADKDASFKASSIQNVIEAATEAANLNIVDDPTIDALAERVRKQFGAIDTDLIRNDEKARSAATDEVHATLEEITKQMESFT